MKRKKHIFFDLDGTLLNSHHEIAKENLEIIEKLKDDGFGISIATGRSISMAINYINQLKLVDPVVLSNGTFILYPLEKKIKVVGKQVPYFVKKYFVNYLRNHGGTMTWFTEKQDYVYSTSYSGDLVLEYSTNLIDFSGKPLADLEEYLLKTRIYQLTLVYSGVDIVKDRPLSLVTEEFKELENNNICKITNTSNIFIDANDLNTDKVNAIKVILQELSIDENDVFVFGDSNNDLGMIKYFSNSVAMANASEAVKESAKEVIGNNNTTTIAEYLIGKFY
ncbi:HAD family hydrolase [Malacoplasma muris]|uniref:HAD family hydrolase n=1 Tax=Malacoplasma muris TaxID=2119 RepID=UPI00398E78D1